MGIQRPRALAKERSGVVSRQGTEAEDVFSTEIEAAPARCQHGQPGMGLQEIGKERPGGQQMFEIVEQKEEIL
ncbi:MAG: hypothetical protein ACTHMX_08475, partial [Thermomicrobiales bacterium]